MHSFVIAAFISQDVLPESTANDRGNSQQGDHSDKNEVIWIQAITRQ